MHDDRHAYDRHDPLAAYWQRRHKRDRLVAVALGAVQLLVLAGAYIVLTRH
jgi:type II secretory pathway component PulM